MAGTASDFVHPCYDVFPEPLPLIDRDWIAAVKALRCGVIAWNTSEPEVAAALFDAGANGVCADDPQTLVQAVRSLG